MGTVSDVIGKELWNKPRFVVMSEEGMLSDKIAEVMSCDGSRSVTELDDEAKARKLAVLLSGGDDEWRVHDVEFQAEKELRIGLIRQTLTSTVIKHGGRVTRADYEQLVATVKIVPEGSVVVKKVFAEDTLRPRRLVTRPRAAMITA